MKLLIILLASFIPVCVSFDDTILFNKLEIVSELLPETCWNTWINSKKNMDYAIDDDQIPNCVTTFDKDKRPCNNWYKNGGGISDAYYKPTSCTRDGQFGPVQCKGERTTGRCFCINKKGKRLFGQQWWSKADDMTCACSVKKAEMSDPASDNYIYYSSLHCNQMGNYENLQCDVISEQCWCADEKTGDLLSPVVPMSAMSKLPCYDSLTIGTQYLRQCESKKYAQANIQYQLKLRGTDVSFGTFLCDDDGAFGSFLINDGQTYCTWRDNSKIGSWATDANSASSTNCNCARDSKYFANAGKQQSQICAPNGNYKPYQEIGGSKYCVDFDGYKSYEGSLNDESDCAAYHSYDDQY